EQLSVAEIWTAGPEATGYTIADCPVQDAGSSSGSSETAGTPGAVDSIDIRKAYDRANRLAAQTRGRGFKSAITTHWFMDNKFFEYRNDLKDGAKEFVLVDVTQGTRAPAFDHAKLAAALGKATGNRYDAARLPFDRLEFADGVKAVRFEAA